MAAHGARRAAARRAHAPPHGAHTHRRHISTHATVHEHALECRLQPTPSSLAPLQSMSALGVVPSLLYVGCQLSCHAASFWTRARAFSLWLVGNKYCFIPRICGV